MPGLSGNRRNTRKERRGWLPGGYAGAAGNPAISDGPPTRPDVEFELWRNAVRHAVLASASEYVNTRCVAELTGAGIDGAGDVVAQFIGGGKCLRSTFMYLGWLCGADRTSARCGPRQAWPVPVPARFESTIESRVSRLLGDFIEKTSGA